MTEQLFPDDMANGLVDGTTPAEAVPADLQATAALLRAAHQPASSDELSGMAAMVQAFTAEVAAASPTTTSRSTPMFATRITRRAATMVAVTLLAAGTAAAAAGGVLPTPFSGPAHTETVDTIQTVPGSDTVVTGDTTLGTAVDSTDTAGSEVEGTEVEGTEVEGTEVESTEVGDDHGAGHELKGLCTAWTNGTDKNPENPSFARLKSAADAAGQSIDDFCVAVLAAEPGDDHGHGTEPGDDHGHGTEPGDDNGGNHGGGNSGNGGPASTAPGSDNGGHHGGNTGTTTPAPSSSTPDNHHGGGNSGGGNGGGGNSGGGDSGGSHGGGDSNG